MNTIFKLQGPLSANSNTTPADVLAAKAFLQDQGFYEVPEWGVTDFPDRALFSAIEAFQKSKGLRIDGVMRPEGETENATQLAQAIALNLQDMGRNGDTILAHISPDEAKMLKQNGGSGTINPKTGLMEFSRFGGNNYTRDRAEKAQNKADSAARAASGNQRSGDWSSDRNRTLGYNDFNPGGMFGGNNRNGTAKTGNDLAAHNRAVASQKAAKEKSERQAKAKQQQQVAEKQRKEQELQDEERRAREYAAMPDMTDPEDEEDKGLLTETNKPQAEQNQLTSIIGNDDTNPRHSTPSKPTAEDRLTKAVRDLQASEPNTRTLDVNKIGPHSSPQTAKAQVSAEDRLTKAIRGLQASSPNTPTLDINEIGPQASTQTEKAKASDAKVISDKVLGDGIKGLHELVKSVDPSKSFSYNDLAEAARNIYSGNGKTGAVQDYLGQNKSEQAKSEWQKNVEAQVGYSLTPAADKIYADPKAKTWASKTTEERWAEAVAGLEPSIDTSKQSWYDAQPDLKSSRTKFHQSLVEQGITMGSIQSIMGVLDREGGLVKNAKSSAYGGIMKDTLTSLVNQGRLPGIANGANPRDLTPEQAGKAYKAYFDDAFKAKDGIKTLESVTKPKARAILADVLFTRNYKVAAQIVQNGINDTLNIERHTDAVIGTDTLRDLNTLAGYTATHDALINAVADHYWDQVKNDPKTPENEKTGWKDRIDGLRP